MTEIEVPPTHRCFYLKFSEELPLRLQGRVNPQRYQQAIQTINAVTGSPYARYSTIGALLLLLCASAFFVSMVFLTRTSFYIWWGIFLSVDISVVVWLVILQIRMRRQIATVLAGENIAFASCQINFSYRRPLCFESPLVIYDFAMSAPVGYQASPYPVHPQATVVPAVYYTTQPVPQYQQGYSVV